MNILDELDDENLEQEQIQQTPVNKGPFIGVIIAILGVILLISCIFMKSSVTAEVEGVVSYASKQKVSGETRYQDLKIKYTYQGDAYETAVKVAGGDYSKYDEVTVRILSGPTDIAITKVSSQKGGIIFCGILFIGIGVLLFLNIIPYQKIEDKIKPLITQFSAPKDIIKKESDSGMLGGGLMSSVTDFIDKLPKKDRDNTKDDQEERIAKKKAKANKKQKDNSVYVSDNILDLYQDEDDENDDE